MATIQIRTEIPGPRSIALMKRREAAVPRAPYNTMPIFTASAEGATLTDVDGNRYIDFAGGIGCLNVGHQAPRVTAAIKEQLEKHLHLCFAVTPYEGYIAVAEKLNALAPGNFAKKTILLNTGAEAVENAVKIARAYTKRPAIICFEDAFHGRTLMAMSLTSKAHPYKAGFRALRQRRLSHPVRLRISRRWRNHRRSFRASSRKRIQAQRRRRIRRRRDRRAGSRRRWLRRSAARLLQSAARHLPQARHPLHRRRSAIRLRAHRQMVRVRTFRHRARLDHHGEIARRRHAHRRGHRPRRNYGRPRGRRTRRHVLRPSALLRRCTSRDRNHRKGRPARSLDRDRQSFLEARARLAAEMATRR